MELKSILEALLFSSQKPVSAKELRQVFLATGDLLVEDEDVQAFKSAQTKEISKALESLAGEYEESRRSFRLIQVAGAWQLVAQPDFAPWIRTLVGEKQRPARLSAPALETLAIVAYRQPVTRSAIEQIRGVSIDGTMQKLLERGLVEQTGKADVVGRPSLYGTTDAFLEYFAIATLDELPAAEELRQFPIDDKPLATADQGLATVPPEQLTLDEVTNPKDNSAADVVTDNAKDEEEEEEYTGIIIGADAGDADDDDEDVGEGEDED